MDILPTSQLQEQAMITLHHMLIEEREYVSFTKHETYDHIFVVQKRHTDTEKDKSNTVFLYMTPYEKLNIDGVKDILKIIEHEHIFHIIIVYQYSVTSSARKLLENHVSHRIELFGLEELQYTITHHMYYCPHEKVTDTKELGVLRKQVQKFPKILSSDVVVRYFGFQKNDILRIRRHDGTIAYRVVK